MVRKFFAKGLKALKTHWMVCLHFSQAVWSLRALFCASNTVSILCLNCKSVGFIGSPLSSGKSKDPHWLLQPLTTSSSAFAASRYRVLALRLSPDRSWTGGGLMAVLAPAVGICGGVGDPRCGVNWYLSGLGDVLSFRFHSNRAFRRSLFGGFPPFFISKWWNSVFKGGFYLGGFS